MDMWPAFIGAVGEALPGATIVLDKFHSKKHISDVVDQVRRTESRQLGAVAPPLLKNTKYLWLKNHGNMRLRSETEFRELLALDLKTGSAWALTENFGHLWKYTSLSWAVKFPCGWLDTARAMKLAPLTKAADMVERHSEGVLAYLWHPTTNAADEGLKSIIQSLKHPARGLPNFQSFRSRILFFLRKLDLNSA